MFNIASKHDLATKEVETTFLRRQCQELGFECFHENIGFAKKTGLPYCKDCWTRLEQTKPPTYDLGSTKKKPLVKEPGKYRPLKTFLDEIDEERSRRRTFANPSDPDNPSNPSDPPSNPTQ